MKGLRKRHGRAHRMEFKAPAGFRRDKKRVYFLKGDAVKSVERRNA